MALSQEEKVTLKQMSVYYSGAIPNVAKDDNVLDVVLFGTDEEKTVAVLDFEKKVLLPGISQQVVNTNAALVDLQAKLDAINTKIALAEAK